MNTGMKKSLKISGILFLVAVIIFGVVYGTMAIMNTGKIYLSAFEDCEESFDTSIFNSYLDAESTSAFALCTTMEDSITVEYDYYLSYYSAFKLNSSERSDIKKATNKVKDSISYLSESYDLFKNLFEKNPVTEGYKTEIAPTIYKNYLNKYSQVISAKISLVEVMKNILNKNNIVFPSYITTVFEANKVCYNVALKITMPRYIEKYEKNVTSTYITSYLMASKTYLSGELKITEKTDYNAKILAAITSVEMLKSRCNAFDITFRDLNATEKTTLLNSVDFTEEVTGNLHMIFDFLQTDIENGLNSFIKSGSPLRELMD